jgi:flagellin-like protein
MPYSLLVYRPTGCEKMKRLFKNKKAVSPVIATVLMIMVTMAGMTILFGFVISYSDAYKAGVGSSVKESLTLEDIWISPPSVSDPLRTVQLSVYNVGKVDSTITSAYVNGLALTKNGNLNLKESINVGRHLTIVLNWDQPFEHNLQYTFRVSTLSGSNFDITYTAP